MMRSRASRWSQRSARAGWGARARPPPARRVQGRAPPARRAQGRAPPTRGCGGQGVRGDRIEHRQRGGCRGCRGDRIEHRQRGGCRGDRIEHRRRGWHGRCGRHGGCQSGPRRRRRYGRRRFGRPLWSRRWSAGRLVHLHAPESRQPRRRGLRWPLCYHQSKVPSGVAKVGRTGGGRTTEIFAALSNPTDWWLHVADSPTCDGWGADYSSADHDAETHFLNAELTYWAVVPCG